MAAAMEIMSPTADHLSDPRHTVGVGVQTFRKLRLISPVGADPAEYDWPLAVANKTNAANEIMETIRFVSKDYPELNIALLENVLKEHDTASICNSYENMKLLCDKYNKVINGTLQLWKGTSIKKQKKEPPSTALLQHVVQMCYNFCVVDPSKLNKCYEPFSPEVYGETSLQFVQQMVDEVGFTSNDIFIDLGSGVGQVVLHVAGSNKVAKCIGIEKSPIPSTYAEKMEKQFRFWMNWFGKTYTQFELFKGDFFDEEFADLINSATFIFVNNYAFGPEVDHRLKTIFQNLPEKSRILSSREFCSLNFRLTERNLSDIGALMKVKAIVPRDKQSVSWTGKPVSYFLHTIDRTEMERYFEKNKRIRSKNGDRKCIKNKKHHDSSVNNSDSSSEQTKDEDNFPKWTRKTWTDYVKNHATISNSNCNYSNTSNSSDIVGNKCNDKENSIMNNGLIQDTTTDKNRDHSVAQPPKKGRGRPRKTPLVVEEPPPTEDTTMQSDLALDTCSSVDKFSNYGDQSETSTVTSNATQSVERTEARRRGRPKKMTKKAKRKIKGISFTNLNVLHDRTLLSIDSSMDYKPPPGCVDQKLCSRVENKVGILPKIEVNHEALGITDSDQLTSPLISPACLELALNKENGFKFRTYQEMIAVNYYRMMKFNQFLKSSEYKEMIIRQTEGELRRKQDLLYRFNSLSKDVYEEVHNVIRTTKRLLARYDIETVADFFSSKTELAAINSSRQQMAMDMQQKLAEIEKKYIQSAAKINAMEQHKRAEEEKAATAAAAAAKQRQLEESIASETRTQVPPPEPIQQTDSSTKLETDTPKPSYKGYKKYLMSGGNMQLNAKTTATQKSSTSANEKEDHSVGYQTDRVAEPSKATEVMTNQMNGNTIKIDMLDRINSAIIKSFNEPKGSDQSTTATTSQQQSAMPSVANNSTTLPSEQPTTCASVALRPSTEPSKSKRVRKSNTVKYETIKSRKDRQVIMTNSAGCPSMQVVRNPVPSSKEIYKDSDTAASVTKPPEDKPFHVKLKINCKDNKVVNIVNGVPEPFPPESNTTSVTTVSGSKRRHAPDEEVHYKKRMAKESKQQMMQSENSEPKRPPVVLKLAAGNNGQYFPLNPPTTSLDEQSSTISKKTSGTRGSSQSVTGSIPEPANPPIPPLKLSAQYLRNHRTSEDSSKSINSPYSSSRSSSVDSTANSTNSTSSSKKSRKRKAQKVDLKPSNESEFNHSQPQLYQHQQTNGFLAAGQSSIDNLVSYYNNSYLANGMQHSNFETAALFQMNNKAQAEHLIANHQKIRDCKSSTASQYYRQANGSSKSSSIDSTAPSYHNHHTYHQLSGLANQDKTLPNGVGYNYSSMNCRYDNGSTNFITNGAALHLAANNLDSVLQKKSKTDPPLHSSGTNGYFNPNVIY